MRAMKGSGIEWIGEIPTEWELRRIKYLKNNELDSFQDGDWIESPFITDEGIRYLTTGNIGDGVYKRQGNGFISEETFRELNCKYAYPNDLAICQMMKKNMFWLWTLLFLEPTMINDTYAI